MVRTNKYQFPPKLPRDGFDYASCAPLFQDRCADARAVARAMKKGDQDGPLQPAIADKCLEEVFVAARELADHLSLGGGTTLDKFWALVAERVGWGQVLPAVIVAALANHLVEARLRATIENGSASGVEVGLVAVAVDNYVDELRRRGLDRRLPKIDRVAAVADTTTVAVNPSAAALVTAADLVSPLERLTLKRKREVSSPDLTWHITNFSFRLGGSRGPVARQAAEDEGRHHRSLRRRPGQPRLGEWRGGRGQWGPGSGGLGAHGGLAN